MDGTRVDVDLRTPSALFRLGLTQEQFQAEVWSQPMDPELEGWLLALVNHYYHLAAQAGGIWQPEPS